jgi:branched-chain amino acid transport system substrate-binding protein
MRRRTVAAAAVAVAIGLGGSGVISATTVPGTEPASDGTAAAPEGEPIVIGAAIDQTSQMAPFDSPAILAAQITIDEINAAGGVLGRPLELRVVDTQLDPDQTLSAAIDLLDDGASILLVTCDVDFATPAVQAALERGVLAVAPCIGTDQMGPNRFGADLGKLAFSFGNVAQDEGAVMAEYAIDQGWTDAAIARDNLIVYFQNVVDAFAARFEELGGTVSIQEEFTNGDGTIGSVVSSISNSGVDVIVTSTAFDDMPALVQGVRSLGDETPFLCSWSCDGAYWIQPDLSGFYLVTYASVFGDDPSESVNGVIAAMEEAGQAPGTGGFITGADTIRGLAAAIEATGGTDGAALAEYLEGLTDFEAPTGPISFSPEWHSVFGREYRVLVVEDGQHSLVETRQATSPAVIG